MMDTAVAALMFVSSSPILKPPEHARLPLKALDLLAHLLVGRIVGGVNGGGVLLVVVIVCIAVRESTKIVIENAKVTQKVQLC